jgi:serine/threonine protein phosphatase PrpC
MPKQLKLSIGQYSDKGRKETNQDFHGALTPKEPQLSSKGVAIAIADGIGSSTVSHEASQAAIRNFFDDYFTTSEAWSVKKSAQQVLMACNSWLYSQTKQSPYRYDKDRGYVCTFSALIVKSNTAHIVHVGDTRIYRLSKAGMEQLTKDHRVWVSQEQSHLSRALGADVEVEVDYHSLPLVGGEYFLLMSDGVYEHVNTDSIASVLKQHENELDAAAKIIAEQAFAQGSSDNLTVQIVRVDELPQQSVAEVHQQLTELPFPPILAARSSLDGYKIVRELHATSRSHIYLAVDEATNDTVALKTPSIDLQNDTAYLERFLMEDWIARRINNPHVLKPCAQTRKRNYLYIATEFIDGKTLTQWMIDHPKPNIDEVRGIIDQVAKGLTAFHRLEMLHQDLRPENILIDTTGTAKIIDFGSTRVAGIVEIATPIERINLLGTVQYMAPEYFLGESGTPKSDQFSLGVIAYQMLSGKLPYGAEVSRARTMAAQRNLIYQSVLDENREIPAWIDEVLKKAVHPDPSRRYEELSELVYDLRHPNQAYLSRTRLPLIERNPVGFWKGVAAVLALVVLVLLFKLTQ